MTYSPECVAEFKREFPDFHSGLYWDSDKGCFFWVDGEHDDNLMHRMATERMALLRGFAANWERVRELEDALAALLPFTDDLDDEGPEGEGWQSCELAEAQSKARKLLEKGNE